MRKTAWRALAGSQLLIVAGCWFWFHTHHPMGNLLTGDAVGMCLAWGRLAGLLAVLAILFQLMLVGRVRWVERSFGMDRLTRLHHVWGFALLALLVAHPVLLTLGHAAQADVGYGAQCADFWRSWRGLPAAMVALGLILGASVFSVLVLLKRVRYECWYATHLLLYAAIGLSLLHQFAVGSDFTDHPAFRAYGYALYAFVIANVAAYRFVRPWMLFRRHRFQVEKLTDEAGEVTSVHIGGRDLASFRAEAGQFVIVRFLADGFRWEAHPFSLSRCPDGRQLRLSIKRLGDYTRRIPELKAGTPVIIDGPHGVFTARTCLSDRVLLIAGGIGITPIRALAEAFVKEGRDITLLYGNRNAASVVFKEELDDLAAASGGRLRLVHVMSDDPAWPGQKGRIDRACLVSCVPDLAGREVFLCGPPPMMKGVLTALAGMGVPASRIHHERFAL